MGRAQTLTKHRPDAEDLAKETLKACASCAPYQECSNRVAWLHRIMVMLGSMAPSR